MSDFKDRMIEAYERGSCGYYDAYDYVRESMADASDLERKQRKEQGPDVEDNRTDKERAEGVGGPPLYIGRSPHFAPDERVVAIREDGTPRVEPDEEPANWREATDEEIERSFDAYR